MENLEKEIERLEKYNQHNFIEVINNLDKKDRDAILEQVSKIDLQEVKELYENIGKIKESSNSIIEPIDAIDKEKLSKEELARYEEIGSKIIKEGKYAVITMAGGQRDKIRV